MHYFKFYPDAEYKIKEVTHFYMYASSLDCLNDPNEGMINSLKYLDKRANEVRQQANRRLISCFSHSETNDIVWENNYMWEHYANNHRGFCVEYNEYILNCFDALTEQSPADKLYNVYFDVEYGPETMVVERIDNAHNIIDILGHKLEKWEIEQETRFIFRNRPRKPNRGVYSRGQLIGELVPIRAREKSISAIYLGRSASLEYMKPILRFADIYNIPCYKFDLTMKRVRV